MARRIILIVILLAFFIFLTYLASKPEKEISSENEQLSYNVSQNKQVIDIFPEVWSQHSPYGEGYEFKVNCVGNYATLNECFLWDLDSVQVHTPENASFLLKKDFNINNYSGEVTRRWVLYGPQNSTLPVTGAYKFEFIKEGKIIRTELIDYEQSLIGYPTQVKWARENNNIKANWQEPAGVTKDMWYKVIIWNEYGTPNQFVSQQFSAPRTEAQLINVPLIKEGNYSLNVALYFRDGYSHSEYVKLTW